MLLKGKLNDVRQNLLHYLAQSNLIALFGTYLNHLGDNIVGILVLAKGAEVAIEYLVEENLRLM